MDTKGVINLASQYLVNLRGHRFNTIDVERPNSSEAAINLTKIISKLSPMVGNLIEFNTCEYLNSQSGFNNLGRWIRQDPGFPDTIFQSGITPTPGFEIKAWFPLATEITARFKDSQNHFLHDQTYVAMLAWLPEFLIYGKPKVIDIVITSGRSVAESRDSHYHNPPDYIVLEPEDTTSRTSNLQQTNTNGYKFQGTQSQFTEAQQLVQSWGQAGSHYKTTQDYQNLLRTLLSKYPYRLDTNYAKMDRIRHDEIELFKQRVYNSNFHGLSIGQWNQLLSKGSESDIRNQLSTKLGINLTGS